MSNAVDRSLSSGLPEYLISSVTSLTLLLSNWFDPRSAEDNESSRPDQVASCDRESNASRIFQSGLFGQDCLDRSILGTRTVWLLDNTKPRNQTHVRQTAATMLHTVPLPMATAMTSPRKMKQDRHYRMPGESTMDRRIETACSRREFIAATAMSAAACLSTQGRALAAALPTEEQTPALIGNRFLTFNTVVRVNQIEVSRDRVAGSDEGNIHTPELAQLFRQSVQRGWPGGKISWAFSWRALQDQRPNYKAIRDLVAEYHARYTTSRPKSPPIRRPVIMPGTGASSTG